MVPLTRPVLQALNGIEREDGVPWVLPGARDGSRLVCLSHHWRRIRKETALRDVRVHDLRHSFASRALSLGEPSPMSGKMLGHSHIETTARYAHLAHDSIHETAKQIVERIATDIL